MRRRSSWPRTARFRCRYHGAPTGTAAARWRSTPARRPAAAGTASTRRPATPGWLPRRSHPRRSPGQWPPPDAEPVAVDGLYEQLADVGYDYGPRSRAYARRGGTARRSTPRSRSGTGAARASGSTRRCWTPRCTAGCSTRRRGRGPAVLLVRRTARPAAPRRPGPDQPGRESGSGSTRSARRHGRGVRGRARRPPGRPGPARRRPRSAQPALRGRLDRGNRIAGSGPAACRGARRARPGQRYRDLAALEDAVADGAPVPRAVRSRPAQADGRGGGGTHGRRRDAGAAAAVAGQRPAARRGWSW